MCVCVCVCVFRGGDVAILDGTNITRDRRKIISDRIASLKDKGYDILWIESSGVVGDGVSEEQFEELKNSPDFLDKVRRLLNSYLSVSVSMSASLFMLSLSQSNLILSYLIFRHIIMSYYILSYLPS